MIKRIFQALGQILSYVFPLKTPVLLRAIGTHLYTGFVKRRFAAFGEGSLIGYPVSDIVGASCIHVGKNTEIATGVLLSAWPGRIIRIPELRIGSNCHIGKNNQISAAVGIEIGDNLLTGPNVLIVDNAHGGSERNLMDIAPAERPLCSKGKVVIGKNVWLGTNVCVLPGVHIGDGVTVAAGSVVTHDIPPYCVAAGLPARVVKNLREIN